jgi:hypothetical protein
MVLVDRLWKSSEGGSISSKSEPRLIPSDPREKTPPSAISDHIRCKPDITGFSNTRDGERQGCRQKAGLALIMN